MIEYPYQEPCPMGGTDPDPIPRGLGKEMTIDEAIKILNDIYWGNVDSLHDRDYDAIKLGIEALSLIWALRITPDPHEIPLLCGERRGE